MKKILILIHDMQIGGAQKSLLSFCQTFASSGMTEQYDVHLMPINPNGAFYSQIPETIKIIEPPRELRWLGSRFHISLIKKYSSCRAIQGEAVWLLRSKLQMFPPTYNVQQRLWSSWKKFLPMHKTEYDVVISYMDGVPNYYAMEKVQAKKKVLWIHNEYQKLGYDADFDKKFFESCDHIITISDQCHRCIVDEFPFAAQKTYVLENITSGQQVIARSNEGTAEEFETEEGVWKLLSVGRLNSQKGYDLAIKAAEIMRDNGLRFIWLIVGEGAERDVLQSMIDTSGLGEQIKLIGARSNPYVYMRACDVLVQSSRMEGKSVVLDEAKILCKTIVVTNYTTVHDSIEHGKSGWIVDMNPEAIAQGVMEICADDRQRNSLRTYLENCPKGNESELKKYIDVMF